MNKIARATWTTGRFLAWEDKQGGRHEFDGLRVREVTGGSRAHQRIVSNLIRALEDHLDPARFDAVAEMRVAVAGRIRYPDVSVVAGPIPAAIRTLHDAVVLFEVLSDDTAAIDRVEKRADYAALPGLRRYVLPEQDRWRASVLERNADGWRETEVTCGAVDLPECDVSLPLSAVYRGVAT